MTTQEEWLLALAVAVVLAWVIRKIWMDNGWP
jgi:hypothetical protein